MKKIWKIGLCGLAAVMVAAGCSKKTENTDSAANTEITVDAESEALEDNVILGEYKGVTFTPLSTEVTDEEVEEELQDLVDSMPMYKEVDRAAKEGDTVNIDFVGMIDGVAFENGTASDYDLTLGSGGFIAGFEDGLIGTQKGQEVSLNLTFPESYSNAELAGQAVVFDVTVNAVQETVPSVLCDELVAKYTYYSTVEECRKGIRQELEEAAKVNALTQKKNDIFMKVMDMTEVSVSEGTIQKYYDEQKAFYEEQAQGFGMELEALVGFYGMDMETFESQLRNTAEEVAKQNAVLHAIAATENIAVEDSDRDAMANEFGFGNTEEMIEAVGQETVDNYILPDKVLTFLADNAIEE